MPIYIHHPHTHTRMHCSHQPAPAHRNRIPHCPGRLAPQRAQHATLLHTVKLPPHVLDRVGRRRRRTGNA
ncbi:hypothetical protein BC834DRAFT_869932 [Gloeopeniophorella convolvens]|nr:hypothetical protein BC834DRAFT_869932 [Gloeopeniophorella convolvens]